MEKDSRVKELIDWFCQEAYEQRYGVPYCFQGGKEAALVKRCLGYFDRTFKENALERFKDAAQQFLRDKDDYLETNKHPLTMFLSKPHKWAIQKKQVTPPPIPSLYDYDMKRLEIEKRWASVDHDAFVNRVIEAATPNPMRYFKGYIQTQGFLKVANKELWKRVSAELADLIGKERAREVWRDSKKRDQTGVNQHRDLVRVT
jgi:hypothetical protein